MSHKEHADVIRTVVEQSRGRVPIIASAGSNSTREAVELTRLAEELGADATLQVGPYYNKPTQEGLYNHFATIAGASDLPMILYNIPGRTSRNIEPQTIVRLWREVPQVVGLKDASGDLHQAMEIYRSTDPGTFSIYSGEDIMTFSLLCQGAAGAIAAVRTLSEEEVRALCDAVWEGAIGRCPRHPLSDHGCRGRAVRRTEPHPCQAGPRVAGAAGRPPAPTFGTHDPGGSSRPSLGDGRGRLAPVE